MSRCSLRLSRQAQCLKCISCSTNTRVRMNTREDERVSEGDRNDDGEGVRRCRGCFKVSSGREESKSCH